MPGHYNAAPQNHHYGKRKGESVKQERMDLLKDNPVVRDMTSNRPWMSKHFKSTMSPLRDGHGDMEPKMEMPKPEMKDMEVSKKPKPEYGKSMAEAHTPMHQNGYKIEKKLTKKKPKPEYGDSMAQAHTPLHKDKDEKKKELKMVRNEDGEMVPFYAADGKGKM